MLKERNCKFLYQGTAENATSSAQADDNDRGPLTMTGGHQKRGHILEDTLDPSLPIAEEEEEEAAEDLDRGNAPDQTTEAEPGHGEAAQQAPGHSAEPGADATRGAGDSTLHYAETEPADEPDQAVTAEPYQATAAAATAGQHAEQALPSTQEPDQAARAWTPLSSPDGWRSKRRSRTKEDHPATKPDGEHEPLHSYMKWGHGCEVLVSFTALVLALRWHCIEYIVILN